MNTRQTVEIAALVSAYSPHLVERPTRLPRQALEQFWDCSQKRLKLWLAAMTSYQRASGLATPDERSKLWQELEPTLEEVFVTEVLTRVWGAILTALDQELQVHEYEPIARNVLIGHLDARKRALQLLAADSNVSVEQLMHVDQTRRRVERWTDLLLGHLVTRYRVEDFAFDAPRSREFGTQQLAEASDRPRDQAWTLILVGLRMAFSMEHRVDPPNEVFQHQIIASILNCFPAAAFERSGPFRAIVADRISRDEPRQEVPMPPDFDGLNADLKLPNQSSVNLINFNKLRNRTPPPKG